MSAHDRHIFCFGLGYTAAALWQRLGPKGWRIAGTTREPAHRERLETSGIEAFLFDSEHPLEDAVLERLAEASHVLSTVPPDGDDDGGDDGGGDSVLKHHGAEIRQLRDLVWIGYLSTTNVYGDQGGGWADENMPPRPTTERGRHRARAEAGWRDLWRQDGLPAHIFRLAGIYGPGRNQLEAVRQGRAKRIDKPGQVFSRIHVADLVTVLEASMNRPNPGAVYNVADDMAAPPGDVVAYAAELLGLPVPPLVPFEEAELSAMAQSFYAESKQVRNDSIKRELGVTLTYPTYREGLKALLAEG
jgi:nucleoside-diphosphate-sugar epimerase